MPQAFLAPTLLPVTASDIKRIDARGIEQKEELRSISDTVDVIREITEGHTASLAVLDQRTAAMESKLNECEHDIHRVGLHLDRVRSGLSTLDGRVSGLERGLVAQGTTLGQHTELLGQHTVMLEEVLRRLEPPRGD